LAFNLVLEGVAVKRSKSSSATIALLVAIVPCAAAYAQIVTPPPASIPTPTEFELKTPPPTPPPMARPPLNPAANPAGNPARPTRPRPAEIPLPDLKFTSLVQKDASGKVIALTKPIDLSALAVNPMVNDEQRAKMADYLKERSATFEQIVVNNLEILDQIENGLLESTDWTDRASFGPVVQATKPMMPSAAPKSLVLELESRQLIDIQQKAFNAKIAKEYRDAMTLARPGADAPKEVVREHSKRAIGSAYRESLDESMQTYRALLLESAPNTGAILPTIGLDATAASEAATRANAVVQAKDTDTRLEAMRTLLRGMTADQRKAFVAKVMSMRAK